LKAVVFGASGVMGSYLVSELLSSRAWSSVTTIGRREVKELRPLRQQTFSLEDEQKSGRLVQHTIKDLHDIGGKSELLKGNTHVFCALGARSWTRPELREMNRDIPGKIAQACRAAGVLYMGNISTRRADNQQWNSFIRIYGEGDKKIDEAGLPLSVHFRPGYVDRGADGGRFEFIVGWFLISITAGKVAMSMRLHAEQTPVKADDKPKIAHVYNAEMEDFVDKFMASTILKKEQKQ